MSSSNWQQQHLAAAATVLLRQRMPAADGSGERSTSFSIIAPLLSWMLLLLLLPRDTYVKEEPGESPNDRNDRAIRVATKWCAPPGSQRVSLA